MPERTSNGCGFCCLEEQLTVKAPIHDQTGQTNWVDCDRWIYKDEHCIVTLDPSQLSRGHAIAVLRRHYNDVADVALSPAEHHALIDAVQYVARLMKERLSCERVYVATLCDGIVHLHYHLIPRYATDIKGFAFIGHREFSHNNGYWIGPRTGDARVEYLESLARKMR